MLYIIYYYTSYNVLVLELFQLLFMIYTKLQNHFKIQPKNIINMNRKNNGTILLMFLITLISTTTISEDVSYGSG